MKRIVAVIILLIAVACVYADPNEPASKAKALFEQGMYDEGLATLNYALRDSDLTPAGRAELLGTMAQFYEQFVGNHDMALRNYHRILRADLGPGHPAKSSAGKEIARLNALTAKYRKQDYILRRARIEASKNRDQTQVKDEIAQLEAIINENPEYHRLHEIYFYLGGDYIALKQYAKAYRILQKPTQLKPSIRFYLPVATRIAQAREKWIRLTAARSAWTTIGVLLIITMIAFYASRPWRWVRLRHLLVGAAVIILWAIVLAVSCKWLGATFRVAEKAVEQIHAELPSFPGAAPGSPGSEVLKYLFLYGLVGIAGVFVFSIATAGLKRRSLAIFINLIFGLALLASVTTVFYLQHLERGAESVFNSQAKDLLYYPKGYVYLYMSDLESYILTNPKAYPNLDLSNIGQPEFRKWVVKHCPFDSPPTKTDATGVD